VEHIWTYPVHTSLGALLLRLDAEINIDAVCAILKLPCGIHSRENATRKSMVVFMSSVSASVVTVEKLIVFFAIEVMHDYLKTLLFLG
jgi:hypothetical protein